MSMLPVQAGNTTRAIRELNPYILRYTIQHIDRLSRVVIIYIVSRTYVHTGTRTPCSCACNEGYGARYGTYTSFHNTEFSMLGATAPPGEIVYEKLAQNLGSDLPTVYIR